MWCPSPGQTADEALANSQPGLSVSNLHYLYVQFFQWSFILIFLREVEQRAQEGQWGDAGDHNAAPVSATVSRIHGDRRENTRLKEESLNHEWYKPVTMTVTGIKHQIVRLCIIPMRHVTCMPPTDLPASYLSCQRFGKIKRNISR